MHTISSTQYPLAFSARPAASWRAVALAAVHRLALWRERARQRQVLAALDERQLRDIGVTRYDAEQECNKPFWR